MFRPRVIPVLLLKDKGLVKSIGFKNYTYIGDPINAVKIFNDSKADELVFLDIEASKKKQTISVDFVKILGDETNMPFSVGGGIRTLGDIQKLIAAGAEKVIINSYAAQNPDFIKEATTHFGSSTITVCIDVKNDFLGKPRTWTQGGKKSSKYSPIDFARIMQDNGAGELIVQSIKRDGAMQGYDLALLGEISKSVSIPVVALGGAGSLRDMTEAYFQCHVNALGAGSLFVYQSRKKGVLINYPVRQEVLSAFQIVSGSSENP
ncbi:MAG TPA: imidazole glycerol phosphate synthase subunit HisF [Flavobacteriales bacterium]|nr:imidazole glycerol phosphate synthase subunit HisF [Flavobacteriales bacterium]